MGLFKKNRFVLSCGKTKNSYGFIIPTSGIDTARFEANPVMLDGHKNDNQNVIGQWMDVVADLKNDRLTALPDFDTEDETANLIAGKVKRGYIKGASIGITFSRSALKMIDGVPTLTKCELTEASICAIPSNANALVLYEDGKQLSEKEIQKLCLSLSKTDAGDAGNTQIIDKTMDKQTIQLSLTALAVLGFEASRIETLEVSDVNSAILKLHQDLEAANKKVKAFEVKEQEAQEAEKAKLKLRNEKLVDDAIKAGKITADDRAHYLKMAGFDYEMTEKQLTVGGKNSFRAVNTIGVNLSMEDFQKMDASAQLKWKQDNPEAYQNLVKGL